MANAEADAGAEPSANPKAPYYRDDLVDFARYGRLDAYELTDEDLARLLEVWRWSVWSGRQSPEDDVREASRRLQRRLAREHNIEVEYNTMLLFKQEIEPLIHLRVLLDIPKALGYFFWHCFSLVRALRQHRRYRRVIPARDHNGVPVGYPRPTLDALAMRPPDVLHRHYWHQLSFYSFEERKRLDYWW